MGGLELYAFEYGSVAGSFEYGNSCSFRNGGYDLTYF